MTQGPYNSLSLYNRFQTVLNQPRTTFDAFPDYANAVHMFFQSIGWDNNIEYPVCFTSPLSFFVYKKRPTGIVSYQEFKYRKKNSLRITSRTFPSFLRSLEIPIGTSYNRRNLLSELESVLKRYPYNAREKLMSNLIQDDPDTAAFLRDKVKVDSEKNLYFDGIGGAFPYHPIYLADQYFNANPNLISRYLSELIHDPSLQEACPDAPYSFPAKSLLYRSGGHFRRFVSLSWDKDFSYKQPISLDFPVKALNYKKPPAQLPTQVCSWLFRLTGGNTKLAYRLANRLATAASPNPAGKNITIICTRQHTISMIAMLNQLFDSILCRPFWKIRENAPLPLPSFNQLCRPSSVKSLFMEQCLGKGIILVRDSAISDVARPTLNKLISGKRIPIKNSFFPLQNLHNRIHIFCISEDYNRALALSKDLKAELLDFSAIELPKEINFNFNHKDIAWLRSVFLPHGLTDYLPPCFQKEDHVTFDWVIEFLQDWCTVREGNLCDRHTVYDSYCAAYRHTHFGAEPPITKGQFVKRARVFLDAGKFPKMSYHKVRTCQKMFFDGLAFLPLPNEACSHVPDVHEHTFSEYLDALHAQAFSLPLSPAMSVTVSNSGINKRPLPESTD